MDINIKLNKNFTTAFNRMLAEYGDEMAKLNGFSDTQLSYTDFIDNFVDKQTVADASIDGNANAGTKDICSLEAEMSKPHSKLLAFNKIFYELQKYKDRMKSWDREVYAYCRDRIGLSLKNKWFNKKGEIYFKANQEKLAKYIGVSRKTINETFKKLVELKLLEVEKGQGNRNENVYYLCEIPELIDEKYGHLVDCVIDGGEGELSVSTIVDCTTDEFIIKRQGKGFLE